VAEKPGSTLACLVCHCDNVHRLLLIVDSTLALAGNEVAKNIIKNNAQHAIVFEAVALALAMEADTELLQASVSLLGKFISVREPNIKYLGLENMVRLAEVPAVIDTIHRYGAATLHVVRSVSLCSCLWPAWMACIGACWVFVHALFATAQD